MEIVKTKKDAGSFTANLRKPTLINLAEKNQAKFFVQFSGQAGECFDELKSLFEKFPLVRPMIELVAKELTALTQDSLAMKSGFYTCGFDILSWIKNPETLPAKKYLSSSPISQPLIFLTQITQYEVLTKYGCPAGDFLPHVQGATGHSQGIMSAIFIALNLKEDAYQSALRQFINFLFWQGYRMQEAFPIVNVPKVLIQECEKNGWGLPTPMAAVIGLKASEVATTLEQINARLPDHEKIYLSLMNGWKRVIISGGIKGLVILRRHLAQTQKKKEKSLTNPFKVQWEFLQVSAPFHSPHMQVAVERFRLNQKRIDLKISGKDLIFPVYATNDGRNLQKSTDVVEELIQMQYLQPVDWPCCVKSATKKDRVTHVIDLGPGEVASTLTYINNEGKGIVVIPFATEKGRDTFLNTDPAKVPQAGEIWQNFAPQLAQIDNQIVIKNRYTEFTGSPPIFGGGMTPTSVETEIVVAATNAGYIQEWAGGGQPTEAIMRKRLDEMADGLESGRGIIFNALYLDPYLWNLHYPLLTKFKKEGYPIIGLTISAGVPSLEKAIEIFNNMQAHGIWLNSLKPGSDAQIRSVLEIADHLPDQKIIMQVEGGKAGGHHSWEDLYGLLERNYAAIRRRQNIILCAGGGIGVEDQAWQLLAGTWHESKRLMPIDGIILGTRLMAVKEAKTSPQVKKLLVEIGGTKEWVGRHEFSGGVTSGQSQLGADVHYADNKMSRVADEVDRLSELDEKEISAKKDHIVKLLNQTAKPYFGDVENMTYAETLQRLTELLAPGNMPKHFIADGPFFDISFRERLFDFYKTTVNRFRSQISIESSSLRLSSPQVLDDPKKFFKEFEKALPQIHNTILHSEDVDHFFAICRLPGKPVNFVPMIDKNLKRWFKSDSLWQAHDPRYSASQVLTIPGPEAVKGITKVDEPIAIVLGNFANYTIQKLKAGQNTAIQKWPFLGSQEFHSASEWIYRNTTTGIQNMGKEIEITVNETLNLKDKEKDQHQELKNWAAYLASFDKGLVSAWLTCPHLQVGKETRENFIAQLIYPKAGTRIQMQRQGEEVTALTYFIESEESPVIVAQVIRENQKSIVLYLYHNSPEGKAYRLDLYFNYQSQNQQVPLQLDQEKFQKSLLAFYRELWLGDKTPPQNKNVWQEFVSQVTVDERQALDYIHSIADTTGRIFKGIVPPSFSVVLLWKPLANCLLQDDLNINILNLLHLSNQFEITKGQNLKVGKTLTARARLTAIHNDSIGKTLTIEGTLESNGQTIAQMKSQFLVRQEMENLKPRYESHQIKQKTLKLDVLKKERLKTQKWARFYQEIAEGDELFFDLDIKEKHSHGAFKDFKVSGAILRAGEKIGVVDFDEPNSLLLQNPVTYFLRRYAENGNTQVQQENGLLFQEEKLSPLSNDPYALASLDLNPIHTDVRFAGLGNLFNEATGQAETIVHGMWTSSASLAVLNRALPDKVMRWKSDFLGKVYSGKKLTIKGEHVANENGFRIFQVTTENENGQIVHKGEAKIAQPKTATIFTGQGSQVQGMGMSTYDSSETARKIWDRADAFSQKELGFSILRVVRDNPKEMLVDGKLVSHPKGVLHLTQFTQVSLTILAMAQIAELREAAINNSDASFAGHSLGEYAALSCFDFITLEDVVRVVYNRGLTMQNYVPRDENGSSPFGMIVVRPRAIGWSEQDLEKNVEELSQKSPNGESIYVVNYNIEGSQYSVTGHQNLLKELEKRTIELNKDPQKPACIWIEGVDVPFHSPLLRDGVEVFRQTLEEIITTNVDYDKLVGRYVPNLNAKVFSFDKEYVEDVFGQTDSPILKKVLKNWPEYKDNHSELGRLLLIELLAYQFASPVQWIKTQKLFLTDPKHHVERILEIGPSPVLARMMMATLGREWVSVPPEILQFEENREAVFYKYKREEVIEEDKIATEESQKTPSQSATTIAEVVPVASGPVAIPDDQAFTHERGLMTLLALKLGVRKDEIKSTESLEALSGGNSAKRNELLSDIGAEFAIDSIDDGHTIPLSKLVELLVQNSDYKTPGAVLQKSIDRAIKENLPLSKSDVVKFFEDDRVMPKGLATCALTDMALFVRTGNSRKSGVLSNVGLEARLNDKKAAQNWLHKFIDAFADVEGIKVPHKSQLQQVGGGVSVSAEALNEWQEKFFGSKGPFAKWATDMATLCKWGDIEAEQVADFAEELNQLKSYKEAFGGTVEKVFQPLFDVQKKVSFSSVWNWGRARLIRKFWEALNQEKNISEEDRLMLQNQLTEEMIAVVKYFVPLAKTKGNTALAKSLETLHRQAEPRFKPFAGSVKPTVSISNEGEVIYKEVARENISTPEKFVEEFETLCAETNTATYFDSLKDVIKNGVNFSDKVAILTGASPGSIAWEIAKKLLQGGATVIATTTSYHDKRLLAYRRLYQNHAGRGAELHVFPFNQGSYEDVQALVSWCFSQNKVPDFVFPFGAVSETATLTMMNPDASTATLRVLLQGVQWLIGAIASWHKKISTFSKKTLVVLPLSPNHGVFGGDGAYADAKIGLESLLHRWHSENDDWGNKIALMGASIGWVRGTGLMDANNLVASAMENEAGMRTFSTDEMSLLLTSLCHEKMLALACQSPLRLDLTGGFGRVENLPEIVKQERERIESTSHLCQELAKHKLEEEIALFGEVAKNDNTIKAPIVSEFPKISENGDFKTKQKLNPKDVVVVVGYGEVSPFGSSRPRFEMECEELSLNGALELAWIMGLIRYEDGAGKSKQIGWVDVETGKPIADDDIRSRYGKIISENTGIRFTDTKVQHFNPQSTVVFGNVTLENSLKFSVENDEQAQEYLKQYPETAEIKKDAHGLVVVLKPGSQIKVPRRVSLTRWVAGQIPRGWEATRFGVSAEIVNQVDRTTLYNLISTSEAFNRAGLSPQEVSKLYSPTLIGNSQGGGMGGMTSLDRMYHDHREDRERQGDTLQETLINVGPAWVTQSIVGSYGPMVHPVAACATALVSIATGADLIGQRKADFVVAGGYDDYSEEGVIGFQDMAATCDTQEMLNKGLAPKSMSRPNDSRRAGFVEAQGGGTLLLTRLDKALEFGLPIYAILGFWGSYSDGIHTSIPAPGLGILGVVKENPETGKTPLGEALEKLGLTADDMTVVSKHDTSTAINDPNENKLHHFIQEKLGRTKGNPLYVHSQKSILGHAKGGAGAWQSIAAIQILQTGKVPGNKNLDDLDNKMRAFSFLSFDDQNLYLGPDQVRATLCTSLGFGHVGGITLFVNPNFIFANLKPTEREAYEQKRLARERVSQKNFQKTIMGKEALYKQRKERLPEEEEIKALT